MIMTMEGGNTLDLTVNEFIELMQKTGETEVVLEGELELGHRNVLASPTEPKADTVEHQKPKAGDLIEITGDGRVGNIREHGFAEGTILKVRSMAVMPNDRVYAEDYTGRARAIHKSFYKLLTSGVHEPCSDCPVSSKEAPHVFEVGDIVRVTKNHDMSSRNKAGDIGVIDEISDRGSFHVYVAARDDVTTGKHCSMGYYQKASAIELVVAKKDRKDSAQ